MNSLHAAVISQAVAKVLAGLGDLPEGVEFSPVEPQVAPSDSSPFSDETTAKIEGYVPKALMAADFEDFSNLLANIATELGLDLQHDLPKIAAILNRARVESGCVAL